jgi:hypothetical protein
MLFFVSDHAFYKHSNSGSGKQQETSLLRQSNADTFFQSNENFRRLIPFFKNKTKVTFWGKVKK